MQQQPVQPAPANNLRKLYCRRQGCKPEDFENTLFWECIRPQVALLAKLLWVFYRRNFDPDFDMIRALAETASYTELKARLEQYRFSHHQQGFWRRKMKVRVSSQLMLKVGSRLFSSIAARRPETVMAPPAGPPPPPPPPP